MTHLALFAAVLFASPSQDALRLERTFKLGERDRYTAKLSLGAEVGDVDLTIKTEQHVLKVYDNGDADVESALLELKTAINGQPIETGQTPPDSKAKYRISKHGMPAETGGGMGGFGFSILSYLGLLGDKPLAKGEKTPFTLADPADPKKKAEGTVTLESVEAGEAKLVGAWELTLAADRKPLKVSMTSMVDVATGKLNKASGTIVGAQPESVSVRAIQFSIEREKPKS
jgi:hypothetical protein